MQTKNTGKERSRGMKTLSLFFAVLLGVVVAVPLAHGITALQDDTPTYVDLDLGPANFSFEVSTSKWAVIGLRMIDRNDHDLMVDDDPSFTSPEKISNAGETNIDLVVINGHFTSGVYYAQVYLNTGPGNYARIEAEGNSTYRLTSGEMWGGVIGDTEVNDMYEVYLNSGNTYNITLHRTDGIADLDLYLYKYNTVWGTRITYTAYSDNDDGTDEVIVYTPTSDGYVGIVVVHDGTIEGIGESLGDDAVYTIMVEKNSPPYTPSTPSGPSNGTVGNSYSFNTSTTDPDGDDIAYRIDFGDGNITDWTAFQPSGTTVSMSHSYSVAGTYYVSAQAKDTYGATSGWSIGHEIVVTEDPCTGKAPVIEKVENPVNNFRFKYSTYSSTIRNIKLFYDFLLDHIYIDSNITAMVTEDQCIKKVEGSFIKDESAIITIPQPPYIDEFSKIEPGKYFDRFIASSGIEFLLSLLTGSLGAQLAGGFIETPTFILEEVRVINNSDIITNATYPRYKLETIYDILKSKPYVVVTVASPVDILVTDPLGRKIGALYRDGILINETNELSEKALYSGSGSEPEFIFIQEPVNGEYYIEIRGTDNGTYDLNISVFQHDTFTFNQTLKKVSIKKDEIQQAFFEVDGGSGYLLAFVPEVYYRPVDILSALIYVENTGNNILDEKIIMSIMGPTGERIYKAKKQLYLEEGESQFVRFRWVVPDNATKGHHWLKVELDGNIDALPSVNSFWVN